MAAHADLRGLAQAGDFEPGFLGRANWRRLTSGLGLTASRGRFRPTLSAGPTSATRAKGERSWTRGLHELLLVVVGFHVEGHLRPLGEGRGAGTSSFRGGGSGALAADPDAPGARYIRSCRPGRSGRSGDWGGRRVPGRPGSTSAQPPPEPRRTRNRSRREPVPIGRRSRRCDPGIRLGRRRGWSFGFVACRDNGDHCSARRGSSPGGPFPPLARTTHAAEALPRW